MSWTVKRKARCGWCYQEGHNRNACPQMRQDAANGSEYAKERLERAKIKKCSYCKGEDHIKTTCNVKFLDDLNHGWGVWAGLSAAINIVQTKKIATGAFIYGPINHRWSDLPHESRDRNGNMKPNYIMANFSVEKVEIEQSNILDESASHFRYTTLAEPEDPSIRLKAGYSLPGFYNEVRRLDPSFQRGIDYWLKRNSSNEWHEGHKNSEELCQVLVEAPQEEVDKVVNNLLASKPLIVDFTDRKEYASAKRKADKAKNIQTSEED